MKFLIISDNHFVERSSVIMGRGGRFSDRLENQIRSLRWVHSFGLPVIHLGDFFDRSFITAEESMALEEIDSLMNGWIFLRGNHEYSGNFDLLGSLGQNNQLIRKPTARDIGGLKALFLPFNSTEEDIEGHYDIIFGHIGLEGIPFGAKGFKFETIDKSCDIFLNGHLHNRYKLGENKWNMGSLTAQNFSDDCLEYRKGAVVLDTTNRTLEFIENPYAYNFYKFSYDQWKKMDSQLKEKILRDTSCISLSCHEGEKAEILERKIFEGVYYLRIQEEVKNKEVAKEENRVSSLDHLGKFRESFTKKYGEDPIILEELAEVLR